MLRSKGYILKVSALSAQFYCEPETALKNKVLFRKKKNQKKGKKKQNKTCKVSTSSREPSLTAVASGNFFPCWESACQHHFSLVICSFLFSNRWLVFSKPVHKPLQNKEVSMPQTLPSHAAVPRKGTSGRFLANVATAAGATERCGLLTEPSVAPELPSVTPWAGPALVAFAVTSPHSSQGSRLGPFLRCRSRRWGSGCAPSRRCSGCDG